MKSKDAFKRLVACVTSLAITSTLLPSLATHAEMSVVEAEKFPYTLFASSSTDGAISIDTNNVCINGSIATNGTINSTAQNFNVNGSYYENSEYYVPNMVSTLTEKYFSGDNVETYSEDYIFEDININVDIPMDVDGTLEFIGNVNISSNIIAFDDIIFNGEVENSSDSLICSETGNITIDTSNVNLNGLIYALRDV